MIDRSSASTYGNLSNFKGTLKQNTIKFLASEHDYTAFLTRNGLLPNQSILEQCKKHQLIQNARQKLHSRSREQSSSVMSNTDLLRSSGRKGDGLSSSATKSTADMEKALLNSGSKQTEEGKGVASLGSQAILSGTVHCNTDELKSDSKKAGLIATQKTTASATHDKGYSNWFGKRSLAGQGLFFKFTCFENRLIRWILEKHGFKESVQEYGMPSQEFYNIANQSNCNFLGSNSVVMIWSSQVVKSNIYSNLGRFQKINHFPRSYEITRKDCLYERYSRMQALYGPKNFDFMPQSFNCPQQNSTL